MTFILTANGRTDRQTDSNSDYSAHMRAVQFNVIVRYADSAVDLILYPYVTNVRSIYSYIS